MVTDLIRTVDAWADFMVACIQFFEDITNENTH
jgi:hypothetical protein